MATGRKTVRKKSAAPKQPARVTIPITEKQVQMLAAGEAAIQKAREKQIAVYGAILAGIEDAPTGNVEGFTTNPPAIVLTPTDR